MADVVRVLVVDDSAFVRKVVRQMLSRSPFIEVVGAARDGDDALDLVEELRPDVVTLDLNMPGTDGLAFLRRQMARRPLPVLVVSVASESGELVLQALEAGAVDVVRKPTALATDRVFEIADDLIAKVKVAAGARVTAVPHEPTPGPIPNAPKARRRTSSSSGSRPGTAGAQTAHPRLPADMPVPVAMVLHMPVGTRNCSPGV